MQTVAGQLQLQERLDNRIGSQLSGGQKKRVSIATELLTAPPLLFLDEPTSGLDPGLDLEVMQQLRTLADEGRVVVVVTHSVLALDVCDNVMVLAPGRPDRLLRPARGRPGALRRPQLPDGLRPARRARPVVAHRRPARRRPRPAGCSRSPRRCRRRRASRSASSSRRWCAATSRS